MLQVWLVGSWRKERKTVEYNITYLQENLYQRLLCTWSGRGHIMLTNKQMTMMKQKKDK